MEDRLPEFIIIGGMKCGTTSLYHYLKLHPGIQMSALKETDYFIESKNYGKGQDWYQSLYTDNERVKGEASPNYTKAHLFDGVPEKIHSLVPETRLIYLVRDPIQRIISHHTHSYAAGRGNIGENFDHYLMCSKYYWQLSRYLEYFDREQILILSTEDLLRKRKITLQRIYRFLGVEDFYSDKLNDLHGMSSRMRKRGQVRKYLLNNILAKELRVILPVRLKNRLKNLFLPPVNAKLQLPPRVIERFRSELKDDVAALREFTRNSFEEWDM